MCKCTLQSQCWKDRSLFCLSVYCFSTPSLVSQTRPNTCGIDSNAKKTTLPADRCVLATGAECSHSKQCSRSHKVYHRKFRRFPEASLRWALWGIRTQSIFDRSRQKLPQDRADRERQEIKTAAAYSPTVDAAQQPRENDQTQSEEVNVSGRHDAPHLKNAPDGVWSCA